LLIRYFERIRFVERYRDFALPSAAIPGNGMGCFRFSIMESFDFFAMGEVHPQKKAGS
jgi:hypothetical protein